jgi:flagellar biosynthesis anti-sigma factor FlgM
MKIDNHLSGLNLDRAGAATPAARYGAGASVAGDPASGRDEISLSRLGQQLRALASDSPEREQKIAALAAAYASGSYRVDAAEVSHRLVEDALGHW